MAALGTWELWDRSMAELRQEHLGIPAGPAADGSTVRQRLQDAYLTVVARNSVF